jgi:peptidoglycan hydrolase-like protein with peptidoglycan-binding domain
MKTLGITSPLTRGQQVWDAQALLIQTGHLRSPADGVFGEETGRACRRAKFHLGYPDSELKATYGDALRKYLSGLAQPDPAMRKRITARKRKAAATPLREKALAAAKSKLGVNEQPAGSNKVEFSSWYGLVGPWCAMFVTWAYAKAASKAVARGSRWGYCPYLVADARAGRNGLSVTTDPKAGDIVVYQFGTGVWRHTGLFEKWLDPGATFSAIEGNTSQGSDGNGGEVQRRSRFVAGGTVFIRVGR